MRNTIAVLFFVAAAWVTSSAQSLPFKNDDLYKTMYAKDLCTFIQQHPDAILLDVRSAGEFSDTSRFASLNHGHLKGAINLNIEDINKDSTLLNPYKNKTVILYCSHSQRSRRVSKFMNDNGFTTFYNLNGGMSSLNQLTEQDFPCKKEWIVTSLPYKNISYAEAATFIRKEKEVLIIDVRSPTQFNSTDTSITENIGRIKGAINIPFGDFKNHLDELSAFKQKKILIYGESGDGNPSRAAIILKEKGFTNVFHLLGGIDNFIASSDDRSIFENPSPYRLLDVEHSLKLMQTNKNLIIYDTRSNEEYTNQVSGTAAYRNLGHMKKAVHIPEGNFQHLPLPPDKNAAILVYGSNGKGAFQLAKHLTDKGYQHVFLMSSFYDFVWSGFNVEKCKAARDFLENHEGLY